MQSEATVHDSDLVDEARSLADLAVHAARALRREDLAQAVSLAAARMGRPDTAIAVVGEFKEGKSSLINGLIGEEICPVDDDIATAAVTVLRHGETARAAVWEDVGGEWRARELPFGGLRAAATEAGGEGSAPGLIEVQAPNPLLARGITLIDTPGIHGVRPGHAGFVLAYLRAAHAAVVVSDASAPLSHEELAFLALAVRTTPVTILALAKTDLYGGWRAIEEEVAGQLREAGIAVPVVPVSAAVRRVALQRRDRELNDESGFPALIDTLDRLVLRDARMLALRELLDIVEDALGEQRAATTAGIAAREAPATLATRLESLSAAKGRLEQLRQGNARWMTTMNDGFADLVAGVDYRFRRRLRDLQRELDDEIEKTDPRHAWQQLSIRAREGSAAIADGVMKELDEGTERIAAAIADLIAEDDPGAVAAGSAAPDVSRLWRARPIARPSLASGLGLGLSGLRGAQGGLILFGMVAGLSGLAIPAGALLGVAAVFGGKQVIEERGRQLTQRRQQARTAIRQFLDEAEFEVAKALRDLTRELTRQVRDHYAERIAERLRTCAVAVESLDRALGEDEQARLVQLRDLREDAVRIEGVLARLETLRAGLAGGTEVPV